LKLSATRSALVARFSRALGLVLVGLSIITGAWFAVALIFVPEQGLDPYDEALYILGLHRPEQFYGMLANGWLFSAPFELAGRDLANFRTLGIVALMASGTLLGYSVIKVSRLDMSQEKRVISERIFQGAVLTVGTLAPLFYYNSFLRTPGYNWLTLFGIIIALAGLFFYLSEGRGLKRRSVGGRAFGATLLFSLGLFIASVGKPSTILLLLPVAFAVVSLLKGFSAGVVWLLSSLFGFVSLVLVTVALQLWPPNYGVALGNWLANPPYGVNFFVDCSIDLGTGIRGAIETTICIPETFFTQVFSTSQWVPMWFVASASLLIASGIWSRVGKKTGIALVAVIFNPGVGHNPSGVICQWCL